MGYLTRYNEDLFQTKITTDANHKFSESVTDALPICLLSFCQEFSRRRNIFSVNSVRLIEEC